jgi:hypothetical protein
LLLQHLEYTEVLYDNFSSIQFAGKTGGPYYKM